MNQTIKVDYGTLMQAFADMTAAAQKIQQRLGQLEDDLSPLVATWTGEAAELYKADQRQWHNAATDLRATLARLGVSVSDSHDVFKKAEAQNAAVFG
jgi:WXG100 family type VII secretion target